MSSYEAVAQPKSFVPKIFAQALKDPKWRAIMDEEYHALQKHKTWTLVPSSMAINVVSCKWLFRIKCEDSCSI